MLICLFAHPMCFSPDTTFREIRIIVGCFLRSLDICTCTFVNLLDPVQESAYASFLCPCEVTPHVQAFLTVGVYGLFSPRLAIACRLIHDFVAVGSVPLPDTTQSTLYHGWTLFTELAFRSIVSRARSLNFPVYHDITESDII